MVEFLSIYRKDYLWPPLKPYFPRVDVTCPIAGPVIPQLPKRICTCQDEEEDDNLDEPTGDRDQLYYPTRRDLFMGECPKTETLKYSDTDTCLKKLLENNPDLLNVLRKVPLSAAIVKFNEERLKSTYQVDFDHSPVGSAKIPDLPKKPEPCPLDDPTPPEVDCKGEGKSAGAMLSRRFPDKGKNKFFNPCEKKVIRRKQYFVESDVPQYLRKNTPIWSSEYRDIIGKNGMEIMRNNSKSNKARLRRRALLQLPKPPCEEENT